MIDITTTRMGAMESHPPAVIFVGGAAVDIEFPRAGFIPVDKPDHFLLDLKTLMR